MAITVSTALRHAQDTLRPSGDAVILDRARIALERIACVLARC
jgi:hypothetical protein